jgi:P-type Ca2+ transporter type 2C
MLHEGAQSLEGSSTEAALIHFAEESGINSTRFRGEHPIVEIFHRSETPPFHGDGAPVGRGPGADRGQGRPLRGAGALQPLPPGGRIHPLSDEARARIEAENFRMAGRGLRVLGLAFRWGRGGPRRDATRTARAWCGAGLVGLSDPVRRGAKELVQALHRSGIRTAVLTGDQSLTAQYIGNRLGLSGPEPLRILDAADLRGAALTGLSGVVARTHVFARLTPTQKASNYPILPECRVERRHGRRRLQRRPGAQGGRCGNRHGPEGRRHGPQGRRPDPGGR